jgi:anti-sigma regulatory factor (Ser/Thr protein kinase)
MRKTLNLPATYLDIRSAGEALRGLLDQARMQKDLISSCELAVQELLTNIIDHAYQGDARQVITVHLQVEGSQLLIETEDHGASVEGLNMTGVSMPDPCDFQENGYGLAIVSLLMDEVTCRREAGKNMWRLTKNF